MDDLELHEVCRLCLTKQEDMNLALEVGAIDRLMECVSVLLPPDSLICDFCKNEVNKWYSFKQQVLKSLEVAEYLEKHRKKRSVLENNYAVIEECFVKAEIEEEIDVKPDISQISFIEEQTSETVDEANQEADNTYNCDTCDKTFYSLTGFNNHNRRLHGKSKSKPSVEEEPDLKPDIQQDKYQCDLCHKSFISKMGMMWHKKLHSALQLDSTKSTRLFSCPHCPMSYEKKKSLIDHMKWKHVRLMKRSGHICICDFCGKYCKSKAEFRLHIKTHKGEKQFQCSICTKSFVNIHNLVIHNSVHTDSESPFTCTLCGRSFRKQSYLASHHATHERPYKCHLCPKTFGKKHTLKKHLEIH